LLTFVRNISGMSQHGGDRAGTKYFLGGIWTQGMSSEGQVHISKQCRDGAFTAHWLRDAPIGLTFNNCTFCRHCIYFVWIWKQTAIISLYSINWLVFITETECVYCAVRSTFYVLPTQCIYAFCVDLRTNSDYFTVQR
jgi:hypothetical protein